MSDLQPGREPDELVARFDAYASAAAPQFTAPPLAGVERAGRQRRRRRVATLGGALAVTAVLVAVGVAGQGLLRGTPDLVGPGGRPSATGTPSDSALARTDLKDVVVDLPPWPTDGGAANRCPATGEVRFTGGSATVAGLVHTLSDSFLKLGEVPWNEPLTGRLSNLADEVRVVRVYCQVTDKSDPVGIALLAVTGRPDGGWRGLGYLATEPIERPKYAPVADPFWIQTRTEVGFANGNLVVDLQRWVGSVLYAQHREFGWTGSALAQVGGPTAFPARLTLADADPRNWVYDLSGVEHGTDEIACIPWSSVRVRDGVGDVGGSDSRGGADGCSAGRARLLLDSSGTVGGAGAVRFVTIAVEIDGRPPVVAAYAMYDRRGALVVQLLDSRRVESVQPPGVQRIAGDRLELSLPTALGERGFQWRWSEAPAAGAPAQAFVPVS